MLTSGFVTLYPTQTRISKVGGIQFHMFPAHACTLHHMHVTACCMYVVTVLICRLLDLRLSGEGCRSLIPLTFELRPNSTTHNGFLLPQSQVRCNNNNNCMEQTFLHTVIRSNIAIPLIDHESNLSITLYLADLPHLHGNSGWLH